MNRTRNRAAGQAAAAADNERLRAALEYAARGWAVFPVRERGKEPLTRRGCNDATTNPSVISRWWHRWPSANVAIAAGPSRLLVIDVDLGKAGDATLDALIDRLGPLPDGPTARTGGGGSHRYFAAAEGVRCRIGIAPGIDIRAAGGYVVAPPSIHASGRRYSWIRPPDSSPLPSLPDSWLRWLRSKPAADVTESNRGQQTTTEKTTDAILGGGVASQANGDGIKDAIEEAIRSTLPTGPGLRHRQVFELARALKAIAPLTDAKAIDLEEIVHEWHRRALPHIRTEPFEQTLIDFCRGWPRVKIPKGRTMEAIVERARRAPLPKCAERFESEPARLLVGVCRELQRMAGDAPFFLSCRVAAASLDIDHVRAWRHLFLLEQYQILAVVARGTKTHATRYRYLGD